MYAVVMHNFFGKAALSFLNSYPQYTSMFLALSAYQVTCMKGQGSVVLEFVFSRS